MDTVTKLEQDLAHKHKAELGKRRIGQSLIFPFRLSSFVDPDPPDP